ncbi:MAG: hypothetical protein KAQ68_11540, partial [Clostridiales bacterium]|nr:hypothetical protein [Clostridiales bacterium]
EIEEIEEIEEIPVPNISMTADETNIPRSVFIGLSDDYYDEDEVFQSLLSEYTIEEIPYIKLGETINIRFDEVPDNYEIWDYIIDTKGKLKYPAKLRQEIIVEMKEEIATFKLDVNMASLLSSYYDPNSQGATVRGFKIICTYGEGVIKYAFVLRTDN